MSDADFCEYLFAYGQVELVPERAFDLPRQFRLSYAYFMNDLENGCAL